MNKKKYYSKITLSIFTLCILFFSIETKAQSLNTLQNKIENHNEIIKRLETEIATYEKQVEETDREAKTLQNTIKILDINQKKISTEITKTEKNITNTNQEIKTLANQIKDLEEKILYNNLSISSTIGKIRQYDDQSLLEQMLTGKSISETLDSYESISKFQETVSKHSKELEKNKIELHSKKGLTETEKQKLEKLKNQLGDQNTILVSNKKEKNDLLKITKNQETEFKKILAEKQAEKERFEQELFKFESELKRNIDPNSFPESSKNLFTWPLDNIKITQYFGKTKDARRLYTSGTHNGVDFGASIGTPVKAILNGKIRAVGNTDAQRGCYSYGKWVLITHPNGISSLYAHLDLIKVVENQIINTSDIIGYSGQTGYATGPHLHLSMYASQGVEIQKYSSSKNCKNVSIPVASKDAYLDPLQYF